MVKNITIKDEAFEYLKTQKGGGSYSDVILKRKNQELKEANAKYGEVLIPISQSLKEKVDTLKGEVSYSDFIATLLQKKSAHEAITDAFGKGKDGKWDYAAMREWRENMGRSYRQK